MAWAIDSLTWQIGGDNTYVYWDPIESYCVAGRAGYGDQKLLLVNLKRMKTEMFEGPGELDSYGIIAAFKRVNELLGMDMPFDKDL